MLQNTTNRNSVIYLLLFISIYFLTPISIIAQSNQIDTSNYPNLRNLIKDQTFFISFNPTNPESYLRRSYYKSQLMDHKGAIEDLDKVIALTPNDFQAYNSRAFSKEALSDLTGAIDDYTKCIKINSDFPDAYYSRGLDLYKLKKYNEAIPDLNKAIELFTKYSSHSLQRPDIIKSYLAMGYCNTELGNSDKAIDNFTMVINMDSTAYKAYNNRGANKFYKSDYKGALKDQDKALKLNPNYAQGYNKRGETKIGFKKYNEALIDFNKSVELDSTNLSVYNNRAYAKFYLKDYKGALEDINKSITLSPTMPENFHTRGIIYEGMNDLIKAEDDFKMEEILRKKMLAK